MYSNNSRTFAEYKHPLSMIIENVLGTFEVDDVNRTIKAISLVGDEFLKQYLSIQYSYSRHDYVPHFGYMPLRTVTREVTDWRTMLIKSLKEGHSFTYYSNKTRYFILLDELLPTDPSVVGRRKTPYIVNQALSIYDHGVSCAYALPLDYETMERVLEEEDFTSSNGTDIVTFAAYNSDKGLSNFEQMSIEAMATAQSLEIIDVFKKQVEELHRQLGSMQDIYIKEIERLTRERDHAREELAKAKGKASAKAQRMKTANKVTRLPDNPRWNQIRLSHLYDKLKESGFIDDRTPLDVFLFPFGYGNLKTNDQKIKWAKKAKTNKFGSKKSLLDLLQQMGYRRPPISVKCINDIFDFDNVKRKFGQPDMTAHKDLSMPINEEYHEDLVVIISQI